MILPRRWSGLMSKVQREPRAYSTPDVLPLPFVNMDPSKLRQCTHAFSYQRNRKKLYGIAPLSSLTFHLKRQKIWFWLRGNLGLLSFPASTWLGEFHYLLSDRRNYGAGAPVFW